MVLTQLEKVDGEIALLLDGELLSSIGITENDSVNVEIRNGSLVITPARPRSLDEEQFQAALDRVVTERADLLRRLAD